MSRDQILKETDWDPVVRAVLEACGPDMSRKDVTSFLLLLLRKRAGLTQIEMSRYLHLTLYEYRQLERGRSEVSATLLANLALTYHIHTKDVYWLLP